MKKAGRKKSKTEDDDLLSEYDFSQMKGGVRGKYYRAYREGYSVTIHKKDGTVETKRYKPEGDAIVLDADVREFFPDAEAVNQALRGLIALLPKKPHRRARKRPAHASAT